MCVCVYVCVCVCVSSHVEFHEYLLQVISIVHCFCQIFQTVYSVWTELMYVRLSWSAKTGVFMCGSPLKKLAF